MIILVLGVLGSGEEALASALQAANIPCLLEHRYQALAYDALRRRHRRSRLTDDAIQQFAKETMMRDALAAPSAVVVLVGTASITLPEAAHTFFIDLSPEELEAVFEQHATRALAGAGTLPRHVNPWDAAQWLRFHWHLGLRDTTLEQFVSTFNRERRYRVRAGAVAAPLTDIVRKIKMQALAG